MWQTPLALPVCSCPPAAAANGLVMSLPEFVFCILLAATVSGLTVAFGPVWRHVRDYRSNRRWENLCIPFHKRHVPVPASTAQVGMLLVA
jgi:hypothetical protein